MMSSNYESMERGNKMRQLLAVLILLAGCSQGRVCVQSHEEKKIIPAWTQYIMIGKVMTPITHPEEEVTVEVCALYEDELPERPEPL